MSVMLSVVSKYSYIELHQNGARFVFKANIHKNFTYIYVHQYSGITLGERVSLVFMRNGFTVFYVRLLNTT